ncbi:MAG: helix-turn-helix transcriptional regulator [Lachnospiraceae bacterium]|nr:helix-turn-helix transcriptional regulator [Lachnospiraceae bacterium]
MSFYKDMEKSLLEAIEIEKGNLPTAERKGMPAITYYVPNNDSDLIDKFIELRKKENISQTKLAELTGSKQQAISRTENKEHSPSLKLFCSMVNALGYKIELVKKE